LHGEALIQVHAWRLTKPARVKSNSEIPIDESLAGLLQCCPDSLPHLLPE